MALGFARAKAWPGAQLLYLPLEEGVEAGKRRPQRYGL